MMLFADAEVSLTRNPSHIKGKSFFFPFDHGSSGKIFSFEEKE